MTDKKPFEYELPWLLVEMPDRQICACQAAPDWDPRPNQKLEDEIVVFPDGWRKQVFVPTRGSKILKVYSPDTMTGKLLNFLFTSNISGMARDHASQGLTELLTAVAKAGNKRVEE